MFKTLFLCFIEARHPRTNVVAFLNDKCGIFVAKSAIKSLVFASKGLFNRPLDANTRDLMADFATKMPHLSFKNATTFVLGCLASIKHKNNVLNKNEVKKIFSLLHHFKDTENISPSDVIRYAKFAMINNFYIEDLAINEEDRESEEESEKEYEE